MPQLSNIGVQLRINNWRNADIARGDQVLVPTWNWALENGTLIDQADLVYADSVTLAASTNLDLDLTGSLTDQALGSAVNFARIKGIFVKAAAANTQAFTMGGAPSNAFVGPFGAAAHTIQIRPNGGLVMIAPDATAWPVVATTGDLLRFANGAGAAVNFDVILIGSSA